MHLSAPLKSNDVKQRFTDLYENFVDSLQNVRGVTGIPLKYRARVDLIPKDEVLDPSNTFATPDDEMIAHVYIILSTNEADADLENYGPEKNIEWAKVDNIRLFELLTAMFGGTFD